MEILNIDEALVLIEEDCQPYLKTIKNSTKNRILIRGSKDEIRIMKKFNHNLDNRIPRDMSISIHNEINARFNKAKIRKV